MDTFFSWSKGSLWWVAQCILPRVSPGWVGTLWLQHWITNYQVFFVLFLTFSGESKPVNNLRKLNELPYHLLHSNQLDKLKTEVLINYEWTLAKLKATSLRILLDDIQSPLIVKPNDLELRLMSDTLQLSAVALGKDPNQLGSQLMGRLYNIIATDKPMSVGDPKKYPSVAVMFGALNRSSVPLLMPSATCLSQPGGVLFDLLAGHTSEITAVTVSSDGSIAGTASTDGTVKMWDLRSRKVLKTLLKMGTEVGQSTDGDEIIIIIIY